AKGPVAFALDEGNGTRPDKRSQLMLDARTARLVEHKTYAQQEGGQQARAWLRWIHTGEAGGIIGQLIAMFASAAAVVLVYTGMALALRRFSRYLRGAPAPQPLVEEESNA
ncbi:MAG TPA: PepSY-associated TM helix domain-containing protein, partial [Thermoanaerobaculia bacterium]|nr:PepSY-associated TM helix domain-containing protein [Thermoanaerobaculia bacterium]